MLSMLPQVWRNLSPTLSPSSSSPCRVKTSPYCSLGCSDWLLTSRPVRRGPPHRS